MDVRAKQRPSYQRCLFNFELRVAGFATRHLNRYNPQKPQKWNYFQLLNIKIQSIICSKDFPFAAESL
jgi:hypothetical protein